MAYNNTAPYGYPEQPRQHQGGLLGRIEDKLEERRERKEFERETGMKAPHHMHQGGVVAPMAQGTVIGEHGHHGHHHGHHHEAGYGGMTAQGYTPASAAPVGVVDARIAEGGAYGGHHAPAMTSSGYTTHATNIDPVTGQPKPGIGQRVENAIRDAAKTKGIGETLRVMGDDLKGQGPNGALGASNTTYAPAHHGAMPGTHGTTYGTTTRY